MCSINFLFCSTWDLFPTLHYGGRPKSGGTVRAMRPPVQACAVCLCLSVFLSLRVGPPRWPCHAQCPCCRVKNRYAGTWGMIVNPYTGDMIGSHISSIPTHLGTQLGCLRNHIPNPAKRSTTPSSVFEEKKQKRRPEEHTKNKKHAGKIFPMVGCTRFLASSWGLGPRTGLVPPVCTYLLPNNLGMAQVTYRHLHE